MSDKHTLGPDIDLDYEVVVDRRGRRVTEARAEKTPKRRSVRLAVGGHRLRVGRAGRPKSRSGSRGSCATRRCGAPAKSKSVSDVAR